MRLTLAVHKAFTVSKTTKDDIDFVVRPNTEDKTTYVSLLVKQEVAAVCEVAAMYRSFGTAAVVNDLAKILYAVTSGNNFVTIFISTNTDRFGPLFPYSTKNNEVPMLGQIIHSARLELKRNKKSSVRYLISLSCACIAPRGSVIDMLLPDNNMLSLSRDESGVVHYDNLSEITCTTDAELAAIILAIQGEYTRVLENPTYNITSPDTKQKSKEKEKTKRVPCLRLNIAIRKYELENKAESSNDDEDDAQGNDDTAPTETAPSPSGLHLSPPGTRIKPHEKPTKGCYWNEVSMGTMTFYYITINDVLGIVGKTSRLSTYILPEINKPNASSFFEIDAEADTKTCLMTFDIMNDFLHRGSHAWRAAGVNIFRLSEAQLSHSTVADLNGSRARSRSSRSYFTVEELDSGDHDRAQISMKRTKGQIENDRKKRNFRNQISRQSQSNIKQFVDRASEQLSLRKESLSNISYQDSEDSVDAFRTTPTRPTVALKKKNTRPLSRTIKQKHTSHGSPVVSKIVSGKNREEGRLKDSADSDAKLSKFTHVVSLTGRLANEEKEYIRKSTINNSTTKRPESRRASSPVIVRPKEQSLSDARITRAHATAKQGSGNSRAMSSVLEKTELFNLSRGSSIGSRPESCGKSRQANRENNSPKSGKMASMESPVRKTSRRRENERSPMLKRTSIDVDLLSQYKGLRVTSDEQGQFDLMSKMQLEIKRLARELDETRIAKVVIESGKNELIAENNRLKEEAAVLAENHKHKLYTIKRLEKQLMEARSKAVNASIIAKHNSTDSAIESSIAGRRRRSYDDLLVEIESLRMLNSELQAELVVQQEQPRVTDNTLLPKSDEHETNVKINELQQLLHNTIAENKNLRLEITALQEMLDVQRFLASCPSQVENKEENNLFEVERRLREVTQINQQYEVQLAELEKAVTAADDRLALYESRQSRETLLVETITQLRTQIHQMTKKLLAYEQQQQDGDSLSVPVK